MSDKSTKESLQTKHWVAILLVAATGLLHVYAGFIEGRVPVLLAGVGYVGALVLFVVDYRRRVLYLVGIPYTLVQLPLWYVANAGEYTVVGYADKTIQAVLVVMLAYLYWVERTDATAERSSSAS